MNRTAVRIGTGVAALALATAGAPALAGHGHGGNGATPQTITELDGPRGVDIVGRGKTLVTETGGAFSLVIERKRGPAKVIELGTVPSGIPPAIAQGRHGTIYLLVGAAGPPEEETVPELGTDAEPAASPTLYKWRWGWSAPRPVADIGAYQARDLDPYDQEGHPEESNPFGLAALKDGTVLVADAAGNDLLRVWPGGRIKTVARFTPRVVETPEGLPEVPPEEGGPLPPAGTPIPAESVPTSVTVGKDGYWYVGELRGFPATPGTSQIWRIKPGSTDAVCDSERWWRGRCTRYADGLTSITDLATGSRGIYALSLSKAGWLPLEFGAPGAEVGGLYLVGKRGHRTWTREIAPDQLMIPGGVDVRGHQIRVVGPLFGPGALLRVR
ncbi:ScyD/ScyE family protein [Nocardioides panacisoli]|uniref:ScyD/ScyE family protein n=1 Tax=Nocardioides panacisoli TaxID=627624 RepID=UPI001C63456A|nr:ScyD/ScyE family protein [Nocardioides panacisoli]QYJ05347.1 ScyD/ScyE family protein [Nocardioides panacisoli]